MDNEHRTDEDIVESVLYGDIESYEEILDRYQNKIFSIGMRFFKNRDDAHDFTQDVFIKAFESLSSYSGGAPFRFWLTKIAYNHGINSINKRRIEPMITGDHGQDDDDTPEEDHVRNEVRDILLKAIEELPETYRLCLDLYFFMGLKYREISEITGYPVNTIKSHVMRAKKVLYSTLKGTIAEDYHEL
jgi:RNA polymerase sigma-70 factor (ECF subfamily)